MNTCVSALKSQHEPRTFLYPDTEGLGCQASPRLSLWTDGLLLRQLRSEVKGLGFRRAREEGVSPGRHPQAPSGQPRPQPAPSHMGRCRSGSLVLGTGVEGLLPGPVSGVWGDPGPAALHPPRASHYFCKVRKEGQGGGQAGGKVGLAKLIRTNFLSKRPLPSSRSES